MEAQCPCVKDQERTPDPDCDRCKGSGFIEVTFPKEEDIETVWVGRCPLCGASNGCYIQRKGKPSPKSYSHWKCVNQNCQSVPVQTVKAETVTSWGAVCPVCSTIHFSDFLQRPGDEAPTIQTRPRTCPKCETPMTWILGRKIIEGDFNA